MANEQRLRETFIELLRINNPSKCERELADCVKSRLSALGFDVTEDAAGSKIGGNTGNIIARKSGSVPGATSVLFSAHIDTVEPTVDLSIVMDGDTIRSDGTTILGADDKAGVAAIIEGVTSVVERGIDHGGIVLIFDVAEEIGLLGAKLVDLDAVRADVGYVLDTHGAAGGITVSAPSHENLTIEITGKAAHAGIEPEKGVSAIVAASNAISRMKLGRIDEETTANVGQIEGGKARNIIPERVVVRAEARSRSEEKLAAQVSHMRSLFEEEAARIGAQALIEVQREYSGFRWTAEDPVVRLAVLAAQRAGITPSFEDGGGGSDANVFNTKGVPSVLLSVGYYGPHGSSESVNMTELASAADVVCALIKTAAETRP